MFCGQTPEIGEELCNAMQTQRVGITRFRRPMEAFARRIEVGETFLVTRYGCSVAEARRYQPETTASA
jgi:hypothetical protein